MWLSWPSFSLPNIFYALFLRTVSNQVFFGIVAFVQSTIWSSVLSWEPSKVRRSNFECGLDHCNYYAAYWSQAEWFIFKKYYCYQASKVYLYLLYVKSDGNIVIILFVTRFMTSKFFTQQFVGRLHWNICLVVHPNIIRYRYLTWTSECWHDLSRGLPLLVELCLGDSC